MSLIKRWRDQLSAATRNKGDSYFRQGRVKIVDSRAGQLEAKVSGSRSRPYRVALGWNDSEPGVLAECTCPHYDEGNFCKHIWATLLAAEASGVAIDASAQRGLNLVHLHDDDDFEGPWSDSFDDGEFDDDHDDFDEGPIPRRIRLSGIRPEPQHRVKQGASRAWHAELAALPLPGDQAARTSDALLGKNTVRRVHFMLDVAASASTGAPVINLWQQETRKDGAWGKIKPLKARRDEVDRLAAEDQRAVALLLGNYAGEAWASGYGASLHALTNLAVSQVEVVPAAYDLLLPELAATGRFGWVLAAEQPAEDARVLAWDAGQPWQFRVVVDDNAKRKSWTIRGELFRGDQVAPLVEPVLVLGSGLVMFQDRIARLTVPADARWLMLLRARDALNVPYKDRQKLLEELWTAGESAAAALPKNLQLAVAQPAPRGYLQIHAAPDRKRASSYIPQDVLHADVGFDYDGQRAAASDVRQGTVDAAANRVLRRDLAAEQAFLARLQELGVRPSQRYYGFVPPGAVEFLRKRFAELVSQLAAEGWIVEAEGRMVRRAGQFRASISSGVDWFDLETVIDFDGAAASLPQLLAALQRNERFVQLDDGSQGILPLQWLERFAPLAEFAAVDGDRLRFRPSQALLLDSLLADREADVQLAVDRQFGRVRDKLRSFAGVAPREAPAGFRGELRPYQKQGLGWLAFLAEFGLGGCLADDMGLGKTVQVLAWLAARRRNRRRNEEKRPTLVVCPKSVVFNWQLEAERFAPKLNVLNYTGLGRRAVAEEIAGADLVLTTYGTLRKDVESLKETPFDYVILDEAQAIKNDQSISAKSCRLLQSRHRLALTGTPVENHLGDLWSLFEFLNPGMLGRSTALRTLTRSTGINGSSADEEDADRAAALAALRRGLAPFILRRTKEQVLADLPEKSEQTMHVDLLPADRKRYNELRDHYRQSLLKRVNDSGMNAARMHVLEALLRLRQTACHAGLVDRKLVAKPSAKIDLLLEQIDDVAAEGHKALVFSQFTSLLAIVRKQLDKRGIAYEYLDGRTRHRQAPVERFQTDAACPLFLISLKAGGTGLNLTAADYVFLLDPWWNPAVEAQAIDRAHRIGQQRRVFAYRLVARDTVEEKIIELQRRKRDLADAIISADGGALSSLSVEDLTMLLS
jgi:superfamily II DNA or RNA helicase